MPFPTTSTALTTVKTFLACVKTKDTSRMHALAHPNATACLIREGAPNFKPLTEAIAALGQAEQQFEEVTWDEVEHVDGEYATVWAKFSIRRDGELHQLGSSTYSCWKSPEQGWVILTMSDIARPPNDTPRK